MTDIPKTIRASRGGATVAVPAASQKIFSAFYAQSAAELVKGLRNRFGDGPPEPEDIAQEAFRRVFEYPKFSDIKNKRAFLWRTAMNLAATERRKMEVRDRKEPDICNIFFGEESDVSTPESVLYIKEQLEAIQKLVDDMPTRRQRIFMMRRIEDLSKTQIARALGISRSGVRKHLRMADQQLSELLLRDED